MLLRLRQLCAHIFLIQGTINDLLKREDFEKLNALSKMQRGTDDEGATQLTHLRYVLQNSLNQQHQTVEAGSASVGTVIAASQTAPNNPIADLAGMANLTDTGGTHGTRYNFQKYIHHLAQSDDFDAIIDRSMCCACRQPPDDPHITSCYHIYCLRCVQELQHHAARHGRNSAVCSECGSGFSELNPCELGPANGGEGAAGSEAEGGANKRKRTKKDSEMGDWIGLKGDVLPSTKTLAAKAQILNWLREDRNTKVIVYTL